MSVYSELINMAFTQSDSQPAPLSELVSEAISLRGVFGTGPDPASRIGDAIAYDIALIRICECLGVTHDLTGRSAGPEARRKAEGSLLVRLPSLKSTVLALDDSR